MSRVVRKEWLILCGPLRKERGIHDVLRDSRTDGQDKQYQAQTESRMGGKIVASAIFLDFGIVDSITGKHREYPAQITVERSR